MGNIMTADIDKTDRHILSLMQKDGSLSTSEIADKVGLTPPPCWRRIKRLQESGYIKKCVNVLDPGKLGFNVTIFATVKLTAHGRENIDSFRENIIAFPEVLESHILLGSTDVVLKILVRDIDSYQELVFDHLCRIPGIQEINSSVVVSSIKQTSEIPIVK